MTQPDVYNYSPPQPSAARTPSPLGEGGLTVRSRRMRGKFIESPSSPLRGASPLGEAFQDPSASLSMTPYCHSARA